MFESGCNFERVAAPGERHTVLEGLVAFPDVEHDAIVVWPEHAIGIERTQHLDQGVVDVVDSELPFPLGIVIVEVTEDSSKASRDASETLRCLRSATSPQGQAGMLNGGGKRRSVVVNAQP